MSDLFVRHPRGGRAAARIAQKRVDAVLRNARAQQPSRGLLFRAPLAQPEVFAITGDATSLKLAEEIEYSQRILETMGAELAGDPGCVARHPSVLQYFDLVGQTLGHLARVLKSEDRDEAIRQIGMSELRARLTRKPLL